MPMDRNNYLAAAHSFLEDQNGYLWVTTNRGLFQMAIKDLHQYLENNAFSPYYHYYEQSDGLLTNEFNGGCNPSGITLNNGKFCFPFPGINRAVSPGLCQTIASRCSHFS